MKHRPLTYLLYNSVNIKIYIIIENKNEENLCSLDGEINYYHSKVTCVQLDTQQNIDNEKRRDRNKSPFHLTV